MRQSPNKFRIENPHDSYIIDFEYVNIEIKFIYLKIRLMS